jgi:para-nitrobenzyl esterase
MAARLAVSQAAPRAAADGTGYEGDWVGGIAAFKGIPYATPPLGPLRWRPTEPIQTGSGVRPARAYGPSCIQTDRLAVWTRTIAAAFGTQDKVPTEPLNPSEDCLYLNVWTAKVGAGSAPVMVWIHGGSNLNGSGSSSWYDGSALAKRGVVVVTINYRLGLFGFLAHPALAAESKRGAAGNYGLLDQLEALRWVQRNIRAFGGDPSRVTVFGESAGSIDLMHLMASPLSKGLFHRAIAESGAPMAPMATLEIAERGGLALVKAVGADTTAILASLRAKPATDLLAAQDRLLLGGWIAGPNVDGWVLPDMTVKIFERGEQQRVPMILGTNALEMTTLRIYLPRFQRTVAGYQAWGGQTFGPAGERVLGFYPAASDAEVEKALLPLATDLLFTCPTRIAARAVRRAGQNAYLYQFTRVLPGGEQLGAYHGAEINYVFGTPLPWLPREQVDVTLSEAMMDYWVRFATAGDPNGGTAERWQPYGRDGRDHYLELGSRIVSRTDLAQERCDAIESATKR